MSQAAPKDFDIVYDEHLNRVTILQLTPRADTWMGRNKVRVAELMNGILHNQVVTETVLAEIQKNLATLVAETGWTPVVVGRARGAVYGRSPDDIASIGLQGLAQLLKDTPYRD